MGRQNLYEQRVPGAKVNLPRVPQASALPQGRAVGVEIAQALEGLGNSVVSAWQRDHVREQQGLIDDAVITAQTDFTKWQSDYIRTHQGKDSLNAQQDFTQKFSEITQQALDGFGGDKGGIFEKELRRRLMAQGLYAVRDGQSYGQRQEQRWLDSQWESQKVDFELTVQQHPDDVDRIKMEGYNLRQSWLTKNPGMDDGALVQWLEHTAAKGRVESFIAAGQYDKAEALLQSGTAQGQGDSIAEVFRNPLNLKKAGATTHTRADFRQFGSFAEGFGAAWEQLKLYQNRDGLKTPRQMVAKWAPPSENDLGKYAETMQDAGVDMEAELDVNDPHKAALLMKGMAMQESPVGKRFSVQDIAAMLTTGQEAADRGTGGSVLSGAERLRYQGAIRAGQERARTGVVVQETDALFQRFGADLEAGYGYIREKYAADPPMRMEMEASLSRRVSMEESAQNRSRKIALQKQRDDSLDAINDPNSTPASVSKILMESAAENRPELTRAARMRFPDADTIMVSDQAKLNEARGEVLEGVKDAADFRRRYQPWIASQELASMEERIKKDADKAADGSLRATFHNTLRQYNIDRLSANADMTPAQYMKSAWDTFVQDAYERGFTTSAEKRQYVNEFLRRVSLTKQRDLWFDAHAEVPEFEARGLMGEGYREVVPEDARQKITAILQNNGKPATEANILEVWRFNQVQGKGRK